MKKLPRVINPWPYRLCRVLFTVVGIANCFMGVLCIQRGYWLLVPISIAGTILPALALPLVNYIEQRRNEREFIRRWNARHRR